MIKIILLIICSTTFITIFGKDKNPTFNIVEVELNGKKIQHAMSNKYGFIIKWYGDKSKPEFYFYNKLKSKKIKFTDWNKFIKQIKTVPTKSKILWIQKCTSGFSYGMPKEKREEFKKVLNKKGLVLIKADGKTSFTICTCEKAKLKILFDEN